METIIKNILLYLQTIYKFPFVTSLLIMLILILAYLILCAIIPALRRKWSASMVLVGLLFAFYVSQVIGITLLNRSVSGEVRYELDLFSAYEIAIGGNSVFMTQILGNVLMFVPLGLLVPVYFPFFNNWGAMILMSFFCSLAIECTQLWTYTGIFEVVDLLNNTLGGIIGYFCYRILRLMLRGVRFFKRYFEKNG